MCVWCHMLREKLHTLCPCVNWIKCKLAMARIARNRIAPNYLLSKQMEKKQQKMENKLAINMNLYIGCSVGNSVNFQNWYISMQFIASRTLQLVWWMHMFTGIGIEHFNIAVVATKLFLTSTHAIHRSKCKREKTTHNESFNCLQWLKPLPCDCYAAR